MRADSDHVGGRTAWSAIVTLANGQSIKAKYWYDGKFLENAMEDASEQALQYLKTQTGA
jgi:hypothetical protein